LDLALDLFAMRTNVGPGIRQIGGAQRRIRAEQFRRAGPQPPRLLQYPHGNARPNDARFATANIRRAFDAWESIAQIAHPMSHPLAYTFPIFRSACRHRSTHSSGG